MLLGVANPIDIHVGTRPRLAHHMSSLSQETLGGGWVNVPENPEILTRFQSDRRIPVVSIC